MLSYLQSVQKLIHPSIYQRGIKLYLDGSVAGFEELTLDYWRIYKVIGTDEYLIKIPLLHLALDRQKFAHSREALEEVVTCTCPYFLDHGVCKHIVAVCASLDKEFDTNLQATKTKINRHQTEQILDQIFEAEKTRNTREFQESLEFYLQSSGSSDYRWFEEFVISVNQSPKDYSSVLDNLHDIVKRNLANYDQERKIVPLISKSLLFGDILWWDFWQKHLPAIHENRKLELLVEIWEMRFVGLLKNFQEKVDDHFKNLQSLQKQYILEILQKNFEHKREVWLEFCFASKFWEWFEKNLLDLDPEILIKVAEYWPEKQEELEQLISQKVRVWIDFLQPQNQDELVSVFNLWLLKLGGGEEYQLTVDYLKQIHKKKFGLIKKIIGKKRL
jgi:hypothetical protein